MPTPPIVTVDVVLLTLRQPGLECALLRRDREPFLGRWALPGGWIHPERDRDAEAAARRILRDKAGLQSPYLEQLQTFSGAERDPRGWSLSVAYYALVPAALVDAPRDDLRWSAADEVRGLPFDHRAILQTALDRLRSKTSYSSLPTHLMPRSFTLGQLQAVYEQILQTTLDKRGFRRRIEDLDILEQEPGATLSVGGRPAQLYRVRRRAAAHGVALAQRAL